MVSFRKTSYCLFVFYFLFWNVGLSYAEPKSVLETLQAKKDGAALMSGSVFIYGDPSLDKLVPIKVMGAVLKSGIYYVPPGMDLVTLLSLAGGPTDKAELDDIKLKRYEKGKISVQTVDLEDMVETPKNDTIQLKGNDLVLVPQKTRLISEEVLRTVSFVAAIATIFGTVAVGLNNIKD